MLTAFLSLNVSKTKFIILIFHPFNKPLKQKMTKAIMEKDNINNNNNNSNYSCS